MGVLIKIKAPSDSKFEGSPSNLSTPTPIHPQIIATKLNMATFRSVLVLGRILLMFLIILIAYLSPLTDCLPIYLLGTPQQELGTFLLS